MKQRRTRLLCALLGAAMAALGPGQLPARGAPPDGATMATPPRTARIVGFDGVTRASGRTTIGVHTVDRNPGVVSYEVPLYVNVVAVKRDDGDNYLIVPKEDAYYIKNTGDPGTMPIGVIGLRVTAHAAAGSGPRTPKWYLEPADADTHVGQRSMYLTLGGLALQEGTLSTAHYRAGWANAGAYLSSAFCTVANDMPMMPNPDIPEEDLDPDNEDHWLKDPAATEQGSGYRFTPIEPGRRLNLAWAGTPYWGGDGMLISEPVAQYTVSFIVSPLNGAGQAVGVKEQNIEQLLFSKDAWDTPDPADPPYNPSPLPERN